MLLHAISRWPKAINIHLWPYALQQASHVSNMIPDNIDGSSKLERFAQINISNRMKNFHTFGCPVYALHNDLQNNNGTRLSKWEPRARLGINLGFSPKHARSVSLVLNLETDLVSPQFHVRHDEFFETIKPGQGNDNTIINWQILSGIKKNRSNLIQINDNSSAFMSNSQHIYTNQPHIPQSKVRNTPTNEPIATNNTTDDV